MKVLYNKANSRLTVIRMKGKKFITTLLSVVFLFCLNYSASAQNLEIALQQLEKLEEKNLDEVLNKLEKLEILLEKLYPDQKDKNQEAQDQILAVHAKSAEVINNENQTIKKTSPAVQPAENQLILAQQSTVKTQTPKNQTENNYDLKISGLVRPRFTYTPSDDGDASEFKAGKARVKFAGSISSNTSFGIQIDTVNDEILLDAFVVHKIASSFSVKAGQFKTPYSSDNLISSSKVAFINRPYMRKDTSPAFRDIGFQATYNISKFDFIAAVMNGTGLNTLETNNNKNMAYRVVARVIPQLQFTGNFCTGKNDPADNIRDEFVNIGANGKVNGWEYSGEFARKKHDALTKSAYFAYVAYDWNTPFNRVPILTPAVRVELSDPDTDADDDAKSRYTIGLTAHFAKKYSDSVVVNYEIKDTENGAVDDVIAVEYQVTF